MSGLTSTASQLVRARDLEADVDGGGEAGVGVVARRARSRARRAAASASATSRAGLRVVDDEHLRVGRGRAQGDEAAQQRVELLGSCARNAGTMAERGTDHATPVIGAVGAVL